MRQTTTERRPIRLLSFPFLLLVWLYRVTLSPIMGRHCRFTPTCSHYAEEALRTLPLHTALWLTLRRLARCHPFSRSAGYDPVPLPNSPKPASDQQKHDL